jgi:hypothetical protein
MQQLQNGSVHRGPCLALRFDDIKWSTPGTSVTVTSSPWRLAISAHRTGSCGGICASSALWIRICGTFQRQQGSGISGTVSHLKLRRGASHEAVDLALIVGKGEVAGEVTEELQIDCSRGGDQTVQRYPWLARRSGLSLEYGAAPPARTPVARLMSGPSQSPVQVERVGLCQCRHIVEPAATS